MCLDWRRSLPIRVTVPTCFMQARGRFTVLNMCVMTRIPAIYRSLDLRLSSSLLSGIGLWNRIWLASRLVSH